MLARALPRLSPRLLLLSFLTLAASAQSQASYQVLKGTIYDGAGGPLGRGVYWVKGNLTVPKGKTLTIQPHNGAAILKFDGGQMNVYGRLVLPDVLLSWTIFTSIKDDMQGGDTNGDKSATSPKPGDWNGIHFQWGSELSAGSSFNNSQFWYGGRDGRGMIFGSNFPATKLTIKNCQFRFGAGVGLNTGFSLVTASGNRIENCTGHAWSAQFPFITGVVNNTAKNNKKGDFIYRSGATAKWPQPSLSVTRANTLNNSGVFALKTNLNIGSANTLTLPGDSIVKLSRNSQIWSAGTLRLLGSKAKRITITSIHDDTIGGDTEKDGATTKPIPGIHGGIQCHQRPLTMSGVDMRYGGYWGYSVDLQNTPATIQDCQIRDGSGIGIRSNSQPATVQRIEDTSFLRVQSNWISGINWSSLANCARNTASQGGLPIEVNPHMAPGKIDITTANLIGPLITVRSSTQVPANTVFTLHGGIHIKMLGRHTMSSSYGQLRLLGTARNPIVITSIKDDNVDGDTNGDGKKTTPTPGDWSGLYFARSSSVSRAEHVQCRYANWGVYSTGKLVELDSVRVDHAASNGFFFQDATRSMRNLIAYACVKNGIRINSGSPNILHATVNACGGSGIEAAPSYKGMIINSISWKNSGGNFVGLDATKVKNSCGGFAGKNGNISADPQFQHPATMLLKSTSPCLNVGDLTTGILTRTDYSENSRCNDHDFSGKALPDMGARELSAIGLAVNRPHPVLGKSQAFWAYANQSTTGIAVFFLGFQDISFYLAPYGMENAGLQGLLILGARVIGQTFSLPMPQDPNLLGVRFGVQALGLPSTKPGMGSFTNLYRGTIRKDG